MQSPTRASAIQIVVALLLGLGVGVGFHVEAQSTNTRTVPRYQIIANDQIEGTLLDTDTGHMWTRVKFPEFVGAPVVWINQDRLDTLGAVVEWGSKQVKK